MNRTPLKSLIVASMFATALMSGLAYADDKAMDPNMPMGNSTTAKPMDSKSDAKPMKHHKKHKKPMNKDMAKPADGMAMPADGNKSTGM